jgi:hypothetical protein
MSSLSVAVVLAPSSESELLAIPSGAPTWIASAPELESTITLAKQLGLPVTELVPNGKSALEWLFNHLDSVDQHHNEFSQDPPYSKLLVFGVHLSAAVDALLSPFGFSVTMAESYGFSAIKYAARTSAV